MFTTNKREGTLRQAEVWRGISSLVESPTWKAYYPFPDPIPTEIAEGLNYEFTVFKFHANIFHLKTFYVNTFDPLDNAII